MNRQQHDEFVNQLLSIEQEFDNLDLSDLTLTEEEAKAIAEFVPESTLAEVGEIVDAYTPRTDVDIRKTLVLKLLGLISTKGMKEMRKSFSVGWNSP